MRPALAAAALALSACAAAPPPPVIPATLAGTGWSLAALDGEPVAIPVTLSFEGDRATGRGPCNRYFGAWAEGPGDALAIGPVGATRMACPDLALEDRYIGALTDVARADRAENSLTLYGADGAALMVLTGG